MSDHRSVWLATAEQPSFSALEQDLDVDVAVIGAGITGLTAALVLQRDGVSVAVIEADRVGAGTTGGTTGKVTAQHSLSCAALIDKHGEDKARQYAEANQQAIDTIERLAGLASADCQFERAPSFVYSEAAAERKRLESEHAAALRLGLPATLTTDVGLPFPVELALRFDDQAHFHPGRYTVALARTLVANGAQIFEHSRATDVDERLDHAIVRTPGGDIRAGHVVLATLLPFVDIGGFFAKASPSRAYGIAARLRSDAPAGMHINMGSPRRSTRPWIDGDRRGLIVVGENHPTGHGEASSGKWGELEAWAREHFDVESSEYRWSAQDYTTVDEIPYVGRSPRMSRTFVATGFKKWGLTNGTAAAQILTDLIVGRANPWAATFDATRVGDADTVKKLVEENGHVGKRFLKDRVARLRAETVDDLRPGDGGMVEIDGDVVGAYRDATGAVDAVSITCTHMGCTLRWNGAETSWDCPCHGSRFATDGDVLNGPAVEPLDRVDVDADT